MPRHDTILRLRHMLDHAKEAVTTAQGKTRTDLDTDRLLNLGLVRLLEIIGEAASRVPKEERELYPDIPWSEIVGLRNRLIHGYSRPASVDQYAGKDDHGRESQVMRIQRSMPISGVSGQGYRICNGPARRTAGATHTSLQNSPE